MEILYVILLSYIVGSIPTSIIMGKLLKGIDVREHGSGNAGGTNALRVLGWKAGIVTMLVDVFKGFVAAYWISKLAMDGSVLSMILAGMAAILGHTYTIFAGFRGGKGVGTAAGILIALFPVAFPICLLVFFLTLTLSGYVSLGSILASSALPVTLTIMKEFFDKPVDFYVYIFSIIIPFFIIFTHRSNVKRLIDGNENRFEKVMIFRKK